MQKKTFTKVWYVPGENGSLPKDFRTLRDVGVLVIGDSGIEYNGQNVDLSITDVRRVSFGLQGRRFGGNWVRIEHGDGQLAFFADGGYLGWRAVFGGTKKIFDAAAEVRKANQKAEALGAKPEGARLASSDNNTSEDRRATEVKTEVEARYSEEAILLTSQRLKTERQVRSGANVFYFIAALSLINSIVYLAGGSWQFLVGLGITQVVDAISKAISENAGSNGGTATFVAFMIDLAVSGAFVVFGVFARRERKWAFVTGMILYTLDGLLFIIVPALANETPDFLSFGFHLFFLVLLYFGLRSLGRLRQVESIRSTVPAFCSKCGGQLASVGNFCPECGSPLRSRNDLLGS